MGVEPSVGAGHGCWGATMLIRAQTDSDRAALARAAGFRAMQFNYVVSTNERAVALWQRCGFAIVGRLAGAFAHPRLGDVDVFVMHRAL